jgi:hypothetical protein
VHGVLRGVFGGKLSFKNVRRGSPLYFARKTPIFGSRRSKLDYLTVTRVNFFILVIGNE